jgi:uncharacterized protein
MVVLVVLLILLALLGHGFVCVWLLNVTHSFALSRWLSHLLTQTALGGMVLVPLGLAWLLAGRWAAVLAGDWRALPIPLAGYGVLCWIAGTVALARWFRRQTRRPPQVIRSHTITRLDMAARNGDGAEPVIDPGEHHMLCRLPGKQTLQLDIAERGLEIARLPAALEGLTISHLSDLHFTGRIGKDYFEEVVRLSNVFEPDLVAITGDLIDVSQCIDWIPDTLGKLRARYGCYFILGNHDLRIDYLRLRRTLGDCGLIDLGGRWISVPMRGEPVVLGGNELPWIKPAADLERAPASSAAGGPLRIVLAHSPDQFRWARQRDVDLLLAGHTHGGQVRLPLIGAIVAPSRTGVRFASGTFHAGPTVMNVSRGVSGKFPLRMNCPPEMIKLTLHVGRQSCDGC